MLLFMTRMLALVLFGLLAFGSGAHADSAQRIPGCGQGQPPAGASTIYMDANGNLCVAATVTATATTTATASATPPTTAPGPNAPLVVNLSSALYVQETFAGTPVDGTHGLPVNCIVGCAGGSSSNAASGVATSSTNGQSIAWMYAFNGASWDQLQVDGSKNLKVVIEGTAPLPTGASTSANQTSQITQETATAGALGTTIDTPCAAPATTAACTQIAAAKAIVNAANANPGGGATPGHILSAASNNAAVIKAAPGTLYEMTWLQTTTTLMDIRFYDTASSPTCSSATGVVANYVAQSNATSPGGTANLGPFGKKFVNGIAICITGANADNDNTSAAIGLNVNYGFN